MVKYSTYIDLVESVRMQKKVIFLFFCALAQNAKFLDIHEVNIFYWSSSHFSVLWFFYHRELQWCRFHKQWHFDQWISLFLIHELVGFFASITFSSRNIFMNLKGIQFSLWSTYNNKNNLLLTKYNAFYLRDL